MSKSVNKLTFDEKKLVLARYFAAGYQDESPSDIFEHVEGFYLNGIKGYNEMTEEEFDKEWDEAFVDMDEEEIQSFIDDFLD